MGGVPVSEATARDFIMVRAALVQRLGGANEALVWARVYFRVGPDSAVAYEHDGEHWWAASVQMIADETGLTVKQVRGALDTLIGGGFLARQQHAGYDRTSSYRPILHLPSGADGFALQGTSIRPVGQIDVPSGADVPLIDLEEASSTKKRKPERPLPNGWMPTPEHYALAASRDVDIQAEADAFRNHATVHDRRVREWNAAFTWWLKKSRPVERAVSQPVLDFPVPGWVQELRIPAEEYLERRGEVGWVESMERLAAKRTAS